jgi:transposase, IS5 family
MPVQESFSDQEFRHKRRTTRREVFLAEMERVVPWPELEALIAPHYHHNRRGRQAYPLRVMLRLHLIQNWYAMSDRGLEDALYEITSLRQFAGLNLLDAMPDETTILNFRRLLETHALGPAILATVNEVLRAQQILLSRGTMIDATLINAPCSIRNSKQERDPEMHQTKKGKQWHFGMKAHTGVDVDSGLVHTVVVTAANEADVSHAAECLHGKEEIVIADAGYTGLGKRPEMAGVSADLAIVARPSTLARLPEEEQNEAKRDEYCKQALRARVEHVYKVLKCEFGYVKARFRGLAKNASQLNVLFALVNLKKARYAMTGNLRPVFGG